MIYFVLAYFSFVFTSFLICLSILYNLYTIDKSIFTVWQSLRVTLLFLFLSFINPLRIVFNAYRMDDFAFTTALYIYFKLLDDKYKNHDL